MVVADQLVCSFEGAAPELTDQQWGRLLAARARKGSMLTPEESLALVESDDGVDRDF